MKKKQIVVVFDIHPQYAKSFVMEMFTKLARTFDIYIQQGFFSGCRVYKIDENVIDENSIRENAEYKGRLTGTEIQYSEN
jgi:hypothetical protein